MFKGDVKNLINFVDRPGMYIGITDSTNIISFIHGYELGAKGKCDFTELLSGALSEKYKTKKFATGWSNQIERYSQKMGIEWVEAFCSLSSELLAQQEYD